MNRHLHRGARFVAAGAIGLAMACGAPRDATSTATLPAAGKAQLAVELVDAPSTEVEKIVVNVTKVTAHTTQDGWVTVSPVGMSAATPLTVDLLSLQTATAPLGAIDVGPGTVTEIRLYVTQDGNYVVKDGAQLPLKVPSGYQSGIKVHGPWDVGACARTAVTLDFDGKASIFTHPTGHGDEWILRPVIRVKRSGSTTVGCTTPPGDTDGGTTPGGTGGSTGGTACSEVAPCATGSLCVAGTCAGPAGQACITGAECISSSCDPTNRCAAGAPGIPCSAATDCLSGLCGSTSVCLPGGAGAPCVTATDCASGACGTDGLCAPPAGAGGPGSTCASDAGCLSGSCTAGVCDSGGQGGACTTVEDCQLGMSCYDSYCQPPRGA